LLRQFLHPIVFDGFLLERVGTPFFPFAGVGVVAAFEGLGVNIFRVFEVGTAVGTNVAELAVLADFDLVFVDVPEFFEIWMGKGFFKGDILDVAKRPFHGRTVFNIAVYIN